ncbi:MAG: helix-hairpin-helix domain-containing protein [Ruminococcus sp.]|nr:helix-hairpin-helix domain-containing protein [Ruminococcus sp.]
MKDKLIAALKENILYAVLFISVAAAAVTGVILNLDKPQTIVIRNESYTDESSSSDSSEDSSEDAMSGSAEKDKTSRSVKNTETDKKTTAEKIQTKKALFPIDINLVTKDELLQINGVGDVTADSILEYRSSVGIISNMELLTEINGIGDAKLAMLKEYLYVSESDYREITSETDQPDVTVHTEEIPYETQTDTETSQQISEPQMQTVNINTADAEEISRKLLIDPELAEEIINIRDQIDRYTNVLELLYAEGMTENKLVEIRDYIVLE